MSKNREWDARTELLLCPGLVGRASNHTAVPHPEQQPTFSMHEFRHWFRNTDEHALLEGLLPIRISFPLFPSRQKASLKALLPVYFFHIRERSFEE